MKGLLDTHVLLWSLFEPARLPEAVKSSLLDSRNDICVSTISFWEMSLKYSIGKLDLKGALPDDMPAIVTQSGFRIITLTDQESASFHQLPKLSHADPFDRMLIWQAISQNLTMISKDDRFSEYQSVGLKLLWK